MRNLSLCAFGLVVLAGCTTIFNAQEQQRALEDKGAGTEGAGSRIRLVDCSLQELVGFALTNRPSVAAARLAVEDARLALLEIAADAPLVSYSPWSSPHVSLSGGYSAASDPATHLNGRTEGNASAGLSLDVLVYDFGRNQARALAQVERVIAAEGAFVQEGYRVFEEVATAYFSLLEADALLEVALSNETEYAVHLQMANEKLMSGEAKKLDVTRAALDLSQAREATVAASNAVDTTGAELMRALGVDALRGTRDEVFPPTGSSLSVLARAFVDTTYGAESAFELARTNAPRVVIERAKLRAANNEVDFAVADLLPSVSASVGINWADPLWTWHWGVSAVQSVFEGFRRTHAVDRAVVNMQIAATSVDECEQLLSRDLEQAISERDNARTAFQTARVSVRSARENLDTVKEQYLEGDASRVDFTDSVSDYATALGRRVTAFYRGQIAEARMFALIGRLPEYREEMTKSE